jgi:hypothetical protein
MQQSAVHVCRKVLTQRTQELVRAVMEIERLVRMRPG